MCVTLHAADKGHEASNSFVILSLAFVADTDVTHNEVNTKWIAPSPLGSSP